MTEQEEPIIPPTPVHPDHPPVAEEPERLRTVVTMQWVITWTYLLMAVLHSIAFLVVGTMYLHTTLSSYAPDYYVGILIFMGTIYYVPNAVFYFYSTRGLQQRHIKALKRYSWLFLLNAGILLLSPYIMLIPLFILCGLPKSNIQVEEGLFVTYSTIVCFLPYLVYLTLSILSIIILRRPGVKALFTDHRTTTPPAK